MGTKANPGEFDCYAKAQPDEPIFTLLARDKHAPTLVWLWSVLREIDGEREEKVEEARSIVTAMLMWQRMHDITSIGIGQAVLAGVFDLIRVANSVVRDVKNPATDTEAVRLYLAKTTFEGVNEEDKPCK